MKSIAITITIILINTYCGATNQIINNNQTPLNPEVQKLITLSKKLRDSSYQASIKTGHKAITLAKSKGNTKDLALSYKLQGVTYFYQGVFDSSEYYYAKALHEFEAINDSLNIGKVSGNIGIIYRRKGKYTMAIQQYLKAIKIYESLYYKEGIAGAYMNIGGIYHMNRNFDKALKFYTKSNEIFSKLNNNDKLSRNLTNIGVIKFAKQSYKESLEYQLKALELNQKGGMIQHKATILLNIGQSYEKLNLLNRALEFYNQCEDLRLKLNDYWGLGKVYTSKALIYSKLNQNKLAEEYFKKAEYSNQTNNLSEDLMDTYLFYSEFLESQNRDKEALKAHKKHIQIKDSLWNIFQNEKLAEISTKYESEQQKKDFQLLEQRTQIQNLELGKKNTLLIILSIIFILGIVAVIVSLRINRLRADHKIMDLRQKVLLTQMNPHFLFNSLTAIQSFILDNKNDDANSYLSRLASLIRGILENSRKEFVTLTTELNTLEDYIGLQKLRFENDIAYQFNVDEELDQDLVVVPPMLAQPFVENALIHGGLRNNPDAHIKISISVSDNKKAIHFSISDNGIGINEAKKQVSHKHHKSLATSIALDRVKIYNFKSSQKMNFEIIDLKNIDPSTHGTKVTYSIPLVTNN